MTEIGRCIHTRAAMNRLTDVWRSLPTQNTGLLKFANKSITAFRLHSIALSSQILGICTFQGKLI
jgi:hypothetical protein